jgi:hypothetical protein
LGSGSKGKNPIRAPWNIYPNLPENLSFCLPHTGLPKNTFSCQGEVNPKVLEAVRAKEKEKQPVWIERAEEAIGHPDESDIRRLKEAVAAALNA